MDNPELKQRFTSFFGHSPELIVSAPGRVEIGGNHTDHQGGRVLAAAIRQRTVAAVARNQERVIRVISEASDENLQLSLDENLAPRLADERETTTALVRGVAAGLRAHAYPVEGFDAYVASNVPIGLGLSSSAAFEVLLGNAANHLFCHGSMTPLTLARVGQAAERDYFGKPCGLMDQLTSAVGGLVMIDFQDEESPVVEKLDVALDEGLAILIVDSGSSHADLSAEYASIPQEMRAVAKFLGRERCCDISKNAVLAALPDLRRHTGDRAVLRALHFFAEDQRVVEQFAALRAGDNERFLQLVQASGDSSWKLLQNVTPGSSTRSQPLTLALTLAAELGAVPPQGASRVLGGGFAGALEVFIPRTEVDSFSEQVEAMIGVGTVTPVQISPTGTEMLWD